MNIVNHATWTISREAAISHADPWALKYVPGAWDGDVEASSSLASALSNANRGAFAVLMWRGKVKREAFRSFLRKAWDHDHVEVIAASENRRTLAASRLSSGQKSWRPTWRCTPMSEASASACL